MTDRINTHRRRIFAFAAVALALVLGLFFALRSTSVAPLTPAQEQAAAPDRAPASAPATKVAPLSEAKPHAEKGETADVVPPKPAEEAPAAGEAGKAAPEKLPNPKNPGELPRIGPELTDLYNQYNAAVKAGVPWRYDGTLLMVRENRVVIKAVSSKGVEPLEADLAMLGAQNIAHYKHLVSAEVPIANLDRLGTLDSIAFVRPTYQPMLRTGSVTSQGDAAMHSDDARSAHSVDGTGIKVGILSDTVHRVIGGTIDGTTKLLTGSSSQSTNDLPASGVEVLDPGPSSGSDEGAGMLEIVHDVAPGADLSFHSAFNSEVDFADGIEELRNVGNCDVIVDDVFYFDEPFFQDGIIAQAVDTVVADGAAYFSAAGNDARKSYESDFNDTGLSGFGGPVNKLHDFGTSDGFQTLTLTKGVTYTFVLQWDQPSASTGGAACQSDVDFYIRATAATSGGQTYGSGVSNNLTNGDAVEIAQFKINGTGTATALLAISVYDGPVPSKIKYVYFGNGAMINEYATNSSTCTGHANAAGACAVGASSYYLTPEFGTTPPVSAYYSSAGPTPILFDTAGNSLATPEIRQSPDLTAPDGGNTTFFGFDYETPADGFENFFGTSAAAPHAGAVAALMLQKAGGTGTLTPARVYSLLEANAVDMTKRAVDFDGTNTTTFSGGEDGVGAGYDDDSGWGLIDAKLTLDAIGHNGAITWNVDSNGLWSNETKWSLGFVPNQAGANHHDVTINRTDPASPIVTLDMDATIDDLDLSDKLKLKDGRTLTLTGAYAQNSSAQLQYVVNGTSALTAGLLSVTGDIALAGSVFVDVSGVTLPSSSIGTQFKVPLISYAGSRNSSVFSGLGWSGNTDKHPLSLEYDDAGKKVNLVITYNPNASPVTIDSFDSIAIDSMGSTDAPGVLLTWRCASENENLGFRVWRRLAGADDDWALLDKDLVPGRLSDAHPSQYRWFDEGGSDCYEYRLEAVDVRGHGEFFARAAQAGRFEVLDAPTPEAATAQAAARAREASRERARDLAAAFDAQSAGARNRSASARVAPLGGGGDRTRPGSSGDAPIVADEASTEDAAPPKHSFKALKAVYADAGVLRIPGGTFADGFDPAKVGVLRGGKPLPVLGVDGADVIVFGPGYRDRYTTRDALFLVRNGKPLRANAPAAASGFFEAGAAETAVTEAAELGFHDVYFDWGLRPLDYPPWFSSQYLINDSTRTFALATPGALDAAATLTVRIWNFGRPAGTPPHGTLRAFVNGTPCGEATWNGDANALELTFAVPGNVLAGGANTIDLQTPDLGVPSYLSLLHSMSIEYRRALDAAAAADFQASGNTLYEVSGLPSGSLWVVDATDAYGAKLLAYETKPGGGSFVARFRAGSNSSRVLVVPIGAENGVESLTLRKIARAPKCGYLAVGGVAYEDALEPLLKARRKEGLRPKFTETEELFDAYNFGRYGPAAIRNAVRDRKPDFLLLVGRSHWDYQDLEGLGLDPMVPTFLEATGEFAEVPCDALLGDGHAAVGRFPVLTPEELSIAIERTLSYKAGASGGAALMAADRLDPAAGDFAAEAEAVATAVPEYVWQRAYLGITHAAADDVGDAMRDAADGETELIVYVGHGSSSKLSKETIMTVADAAGWTGNVVLVQSTCTPNYFIHNVPGYYSIAEALLTQPQGGIAASLGTTTYLASPPAAEFMKELLHASRMPGVRWGEALVAAQRAIEARAETAAPGDAQAFRDLAKTESLLGDPALPAAAVKK